MEKKILIGRVTKPFGITGEIKIESYSGFYDRFEKLETIYLDNELFTIKNVKHKERMTMLKLKECDSRNDAEALVGKKIYMTEKDLLELSEDEFYVRDLIGMEVEDGGEIIGKVKDVLTDRPQDLYVVELSDDGNIMIPAVKEFIKEIDTENKKIRVELIEGMR